MHSFMNQQLWMETGNKRNENVEGHSDNFENIVQYVSGDPGSNMHYKFLKY